MSLFFPSERRSMHPWDLEGGAITPAVQRITPERAAYLAPVFSSIRHIVDYIATRPVDFRKGADSLAALVKAEYGADPFSGVVYVFRAKRADRIKLVWWDGTGLCLMAKRLEQGRFRWPGIQDGVMRLTAAQLGALLEGLDWRRVHAGRRAMAPQIAG